MNLYTYAQNNPVSDRDLDGHDLGTGASDAAGEENENEEGQGISGFLKNPEQGKQQGQNQQAQSKPSLLDRILRAVGLGGAAASLPPEANPSAQAVKAAAKGIPSTSPPPRNRPVKLEPKQFPEDFQSKLTKLAKAGLDEITNILGGSTTISVPVTIDPNTLNQEYEKQYGVPPPNVPESTTKQ